MTAFNNKYMWPGIGKQTILENIKKEGRKARQIEEKIKEHFNGRLPVETWLVDLFPPKILSTIGFDDFYKYITCEHCEHYIGPNPLVRKIYNIFVISGYCNNYLEGKKPEQVCDFFNPRCFYKQVIITKIETLLEKKGKLFLRELIDETEYLNEY